LQSGGEAGRKTYGPFQLDRSGSGRDSEFHALPWSKVVGAQILVALTDDVDNQPAALAVDPAFLIGAEVTLYGNIQGYETLLKRVFIRMKTGPMPLLLTYEEGFENLSFRSRLFAGGRPLGPDRVVPGSFLEVALNLSVFANIYIMPRSGFYTGREIT
jgi:hypothetical protein